MNLIMTIVVKDVRRLRWVVALFLAMTVVKFGIGWWLALGAAQNFETWKQLGQVLMWLVGAEVVLTWFFTGSLVMADPLVGPQATWRTRPISLGRLVTAKVVAALLITCGPGLLLGVPWWWASGLGFEDGLKAAMMGTVGSVAVIVPSMFIAALVDSMGRYVLWSILGFVGAVTLPLMTSFVADRLPDGSKWWAFGAVAVGFAVLGWIVRFGDELQRRVSRGVAGGTAVVVALAGWWLVANGGRVTRQAWTEANVDQARDVKLTWRETTVVDAVRKERGSTVNTWLAVEGLPAGLAVDVANAEHEWTWTDGAAVRKEATGFTWGARWAREALKLPPEKVDAETVAWEAAQKNEQAAKRKSASQLGRRPKGDEPTLLVTTGVAASVGAKLRSTTPGLTVKAQVRVVRPVEWLDVPLTAGVRAAGAGRGVRVTELAERVGFGATVQIVDTRPLPWDFMSEYNQGRWRRPNYYAIDREAGRLVNVSGDWSPSVWIAGVELQARSFQVTGPRVIRDGKWTVVDQQWRQRARLVLLRWDEVARVTLEAKTEAMVVAK
jgi:MFS family permease